MRQALVVLGMHRSGTSSLAGVLCLLGAQAPKTLMPGHEDNPKGYWESLPVVQANDALLRAAGSSWTDWRPINPRWSRSAVAKAAAERLPALVREEFGDAPLILLKDPRICRLFPLWQGALDQAGYQTHVVVPLRSPMEVAASLGRRDGFSEARALLIWLRHVLEAERSTRNVRRHFLDWPAFVDDWRTGVAELSEGTGVALPGQSDFIADEVDAFLDAGLRRHVHERPIPNHVPKWIDDTRQALLKLAKNPSDKVAQATLDGVRSEFDTTATLYGPVLAGLETERRLWREEDDAERQEVATRLAVTIHERDTQMTARADTEALLHQYIARSSAAEESVIALGTMLADEREARACDKAQIDEDAHSAAAERDALIVQLETVSIGLRSAQDELAVREAALERECEQRSSLSASLAAAHELLAAVDQDTVASRVRIVALESEVHRAAKDASERIAEIAALRDEIADVQAAALAERSRTELELIQLQTRLSNSETALESAKLQLTQLASQGWIDRIRRWSAG